MGATDPQRPIRQPPATRGCLHFIYSSSDLLNSYVNSNAQQTRGQGLPCRKDRRTTFHLCRTFQPAVLTSAIWLEEEHSAQVSAKNKVVCRRSPAFSSQNKTTGLCRSECEPKALKVERAGPDTVPPAISDWRRREVGGG